MPRSVRHAGSPLFNVCVELRGYSSADAGMKNERPLYLQDSSPMPPQRSARLESSAVCAWWNSNTNQPHFVQLRRTDKLGAFTFVTPQKGLALAIAVFAHGGDFPTSIHMVPRPLGKGKRATTSAPDRTGAARPVTSTSDGREYSGRAEIHVDLDEEGKEAQGLPLDEVARLHDNSPCARQKAERTATRSSNVPREKGHHDLALPCAGGVAFVQPSPVLTTSVPGIEGGILRATEPETLAKAAQHDGLCPSVINGSDDGMTGHQSENLDTAHDHSAKIAELLRSSCWDYGQHHKGLWENPTAMCESLRRLLTGESNRHHRKRYSVPTADGESGETTRIAVALVAVSREAAGRIHGLVLGLQGGAGNRSEGARTLILAVLAVVLATTLIIVAMLQLLSVLCWKKFLRGRTFHPTILNESAGSASDVAMFRTTPTEDLPPLNSNACRTATRTMRSDAGSRWTAVGMTGTLRSSDGKLLRLKLRSARGGVEDQRTIGSSCTRSLWKRQRPSGEGTREALQRGTEPDVFASMFRALSSGWCVDDVVGSTACTDSGATITD